MTNKDVFTMNWGDYEIQVKYAESYSPAYKSVYGHAMSHIEIETLNPKKAPLPLTGTGYRSIFTPEMNIEEMGGVEEFILAMLDDAAKSREWKEMENKSRHLSFF